MVVSVSTDMTVQPANSSVVVNNNHPMIIIKSKNECHILNASVRHLGDNALFCDFAKTHTSSRNKCCQQHKSNTNVSRKSDRCVEITHRIFWDKMVTTHSHSNRCCKQTHYENKMSLSSGITLPPRCTAVCQ